MKYTIFVTRGCNLNCCYCYLDKEPRTAMPRATADRMVDFIYQHASSSIGAGYEVTVL